MGITESTESETNEIKTQINSIFPESMQTTFNAPTIKPTPQNIMELHFFDDNNDTQNPAKNFQKTISELNYTLAHNDSSEVIWVEKAKCYMLSKQYDIAIKYLDVAIEKNRSYVDSYYTKIKCLYFQNKVEECLRQFDILLSLYPDNYNILLSKALFLQDIKHYKEAIVVYNDLVCLDPTKPVGAFCKGNCYIEMKEFFLANSCFDECLKFDKSNLSYLVRKAFSLQQINKSKEANEIINRINEIIDNKEVQLSDKDLKVVKYYIQMISLMNTITSEGEKEDIEILMMIYKGSVSKFYEGIMNNVKIGVKVFKNEKCVDFEGAKKFAENFNKKNSLDHHVIEIIKCVKREDILVAEKLYNSNLLRYLFENYSALSMVERINIIKQIIVGIKFLLQINAKSFCIDVKKVLVSKDRNFYLGDVGLKYYLSDYKDFSLKKVLHDFYNTILEIIKIPGIEIDLKTRKGIIKNCPKELLELLKKIREKIDEKDEVEKSDLESFFSDINNIML